MNSEALVLYKTLQQELTQCRKKKLAPLCELEECFQVAERYWAMLRQILSVFEFPDTLEEITFFKLIKPKFIAEVEYYSLCYHAELFRKDVKEDQALRSFWSRESLRLDKFIQEHKDFYEYHRSENRELDESYYTRVNGKTTRAANAKQRDIEDGVATGYDHLVATLLALERYTEFLQVQERIFTST